MPASSWNLPTRIAFRFAFVYWTGYLLTAPPLLSEPFRQVVGMFAYLGCRIAGCGAVETSGSLGNSFAMALGSLTLAVIATPVWCWLDRRATNHQRLHAWLRWGMRYFLLGSMVIYGAAKVFQFPPPALDQLLQPLGRMRPMEVLWVFMGTSQMYVWFAGLAEVAGGLLMLSPRTTTLGALLCLGVSSNVWLMNVGYDVPVKVLSLHLLLMSVFLLLPELPRLANVFVWNRASQPAQWPPLFTDARWNRMATFGRGLVVVGVVLVLGFIFRLGFTAVPQSPLYGVWFVEEFESGGVARPPLVTDAARWRWVTFQVAQVMSVQTMDDQSVRYHLQLDLAKNTLKATRPGSRPPALELAIEQPATDTLLLHGQAEGRELKVRLQRVNLPSFALLAKRGGSSNP